MSKTSARHQALQEFLSARGYATIEELARQHGYSPNRAGKALVTREPLRVEVLLNSLGNPFYDEVKQGLADAREDYSISGKARATTWPRSSPKSRRRPLPTPPG